MNGRDMYENCLMQEEELVFDSFTRDDALDLGMALHRKNADYGREVAIEITVNGLVVFRYFPEGTTADNGLWLARKRRTVELMEMSSLRFRYWMERNGETFADRKLNADDYAAGGGGFPIRIRNTGVVGSICVSGMAHATDHQLIVDTLRLFIKRGRK